MIPTIDDTDIRDCRRFLVELSLKEVEAEMATLVMNSPEYDELEKEAEAWKRQLR